MKRKVIYFSVVGLIFNCLPSEAILLVIPEDVATAFAGIYGFTPRFLLGSDNRFGFGFRFGNHADLQVQYELGPQVYTRPQQPIRVRSAAYRERVVRRRRPFLELLLRAGGGLFRESSYDLQDVQVEGGCYDEPR